MLSFLKKLFSLGGSDLNPEDLKKGTIVDVRTPAEYRNGHVAGSINIPLQGLEGALPKLQKLKSPIITCCASGNRSGMASRKLNGLGIVTINGGSWQNVDRQVE